MYSSRSIARSLHAHLWQSRSDRPVQYFSPRVLQENYWCFLSGFVSYAVKANPYSLVLEYRAAAGLTTLNLASPVEMQVVRVAVPHAVLHYHNPVRSLVEIDVTKRFGVRSWSVDSQADLDKLGTVPLGAEIAVRLHVPVAGEPYNFGTTSGAIPAQVATLWRSAQQHGLTPSLTFQFGTQCNAPATWVCYIEVAHAVSQPAGIWLDRLNVGGGFRVLRDHQAPNLKRVFGQISARIKALFGAESPALVCEPGRAMVASAFTLVLQFKALCGLRTVF